MKASQKAIELIKEFEGRELEAYLCPAQVATIGYGHIKSVNLGDTITQSEAEEFLLKDIEVVEKSLSGVAHKLSQNQFDALVSFGFNIGVQSLKTSTLMKLVKENPNNYRIGREFLRWVHIKGVVSQGLKRRRKAELKMYNPDLKGE